MENPQLASLVTMARTVNAGDTGGYAALYAPDAVITIHGLGELNGREAIERHEVELLSQFPGTRLAFYGIWQAGDRAAVHYAVNGATPDGRAMGHEGLLFYQFDTSGLIHSEQRYMDALTPMAQLGMPGLGPARPSPGLPFKPTTCVADDSAIEKANLASVRSTLAALEAGNERDFLPNLAEDVVLDELILPGPFSGKGSAAGWFQEWTGAFPGAACEVTSMLGAGDHVLAETVVSCSRRGAFGPLPRSNEPFSFHRAVMAKVKGGRIVRLSFFMNGREFR